MPTYNFIRLSTGEEWEEFIPNSRREEILKDSDIQQIIFAPALVSGVVGLTLKNDNGFKEVLSKAAEAHPGSPLYDRHVQKGVKEVKTDRVIQKHFGK